MCLTLSSVPDSLTDTASCEILRSAARKRGEKRMIWRTLHLHPSLFVRSPSELLNYSPCERDRHAKENRGPMWRNPKSQLSGSLYIKRER